MPNITMRRFIFIATILILAINGIACACPSDISIDDHALHQAHGETSSEDQSGCCENCDEMKAVTEHGDFTLIAPEKSNHNDFGAPHQFAYEIFWDEESAAGRFLVNRDKPTSLSTPVMFYDRMLD